LNELVAKSTVHQHNKALHPTAYSFVRSSLRFRRRVSLVVVLLRAALSEAVKLDYAKVGQ